MDKEYRLFLKAAQTMLELMKARDVLKQNREYSGNDYWMKFYELAANLTTETDNE